MSEWEPDNKVRLLIRKYALQNALEYDGGGQVKSVQGRVLGENAELRQYARHLGPLIGPMVEEANELWKSSGADAIRALLEEESPDALEKRTKERREGLPELPNSDGGDVVLRFAPNPNGPLSLGHSRGVMINSEYADTHDGKLILRFDDTDTKNKPPDLRAYDWILDEFRWLTGNEPGDVIYASDQMEIYLQKATECIADGHLYVCSCPAPEFKKLRETKQDCPCRDLPLEDQNERWQKMLNPEGGWHEGHAVVRVRTGMDQKNPALRDWPALRIQSAPHPRVGTTYRVWPLLDFQSAVEDHEQGVTHIIRGKDLMDSTRKQKLLYEKLGWDYPETLYWGRVKVHEFGGFSTSQMSADIASGQFDGWNDPALPTIQALRRRGFSTAALNRFWMGFGLTEKDIQVPMATLESYNAAALDKSSPRLSFIQDPVRLALECKGLDLPDSVELPVHPEIPELGTRNWPLPTDCSLEVFIERDDYKAAISGDGTVRLKDFADLHIDPHQGGEVVQLEKADGIRIVHWLVAGVERPAVMWRPDEAGVWSKADGLLETSSHPLGQVVQLERVGFARINGLPASNDPSSSTELIWTHG